MGNYSMAGLVLEINADNSFFMNKYKAFQVSDDAKPDIYINITGKDDIETPEGIPVADETIKWLRKPDKEKGYYVYIRFFDDRIATLLDASENWSVNSVNYAKTGFVNEAATAESMNEIIFRNSLIYREGIAIHASAINHEGKGIIFSAPSETGKTTQANLWKQHKGAVILNGDRPAIRIMNGVPFVCGSPWSGSSPEFKNENAPLSAIILLEQYPENIIKKLTMIEAIQRLLPRCFLPYFNQALMDKALITIERIITNTPVFLLKCRPDLEAVELVYNNL